MPREQVFLYRGEYVLVRCTLIHVYHNTGVSRHSDHCSNMGIPTSVPLTGPSPHVGLPHNDPAHAAESEPWLPLGLSMLGWLVWLVFRA